VVPFHFHVSSRVVAPFSPPKSTVLAAASSNAIDAPERAGGLAAGES
jgi:hypothetical protein